MRNGAVCELLFSELSQLNPGLHLSAAMSLFLLCMASFV